MSQRNCRGLNSLSSNISPTPTVCMAWFWSKAPHRASPQRSAASTGGQHLSGAWEAKGDPHPTCGPHTHISQPAMPSAPPKRAPPSESWSPLHSRPVECCQCLTDSGGAGTTKAPDSGSARCCGVNLTARLGPFRCHKWRRIGRNNLRHINDVKV